MIFEAFDSFGFSSFDMSEYLKLWIDIWAAIDIYVKYVLASVFLLMGIMLTYKKLIFYKKYPPKIKVGIYQPIVPEIWLAYIYYILAVGMFTNLLPNVIIFFANFEPHPFIFRILRTAGLDGIIDFVLPYSAEWETLSDIQKIIMLIIGNVSLAGFSSLLFGILIFINQGLKNKKFIAIPLIISGITILVIFGIEPGMKLLTLPINILYQ